MGLQGGDLGSQGSPLRKALLASVLVLSLTGCSAALPLIGGAVLGLVGPATANVTQNYLDEAQWGMQVSAEYRREQAEARKEWRVRIKDLDLMAYNAMKIKAQAKMDSCDPESDEFLDCITEAIQATTEARKYAEEAKPSIGQTISPLTENLD